MKYLQIEKHNKNYKNKKKTVRFKFGTNGQ